MKNFIIAGFAACIAMPVLAQGLSIELNPQERTRFKEYVVKEKRGTTKFNPGFNFSIGSTLPQEVEVYDVPEYKSYGYVVVEGRPAYVDRRTRRVIQYID